MPRRWGAGGEGGRELQDQRWREEEAVGRGDKLEAQSWAARGWPKPSGVTLNSSLLRTHLQTGDAQIDARSSLQGCSKLKELAGSPGLVGAHVHSRCPEDVSPFVCTRSDI